MTRLINLSYQNSSLSDRAYFYVIYIDIFNFIVKLYHEWYNFNGRFNNKNFKNMAKNKILYIVIAIVVLVLVGGGYYYWKTKIQNISEPPKSEAEQAAEDVQKTAASVSADATKGVLPSITTTDNNPIKTDPNPYNQTSPFSNLKINPFK
ncbi:MAG: hypothetical protein PHW12_05100 [Smithella sp.]|nr:hypothetical protein [Smithella sp.]